MRVFARIELVRLVDRFSERAVAVDTVHTQGTRVVIGCEQIFAFHIDAGVDRP